MRTIPLTKNKQAIIDDDQVIPSGRWCISNGYASKRINDHLIYMHRLILGAGKDQVVDHINGNKLDNRKSNLRICTFAENAWNKGKGKGNFKGVQWRKDKKKFRARIMIDRKEVFLGYFSDPVEAAKAYDQKAKELFGEFARLNFV